MIKSVLLVVLFTLVTACASPSVKDSPSPEFAAEQLYPVRNSGFEEAYVRRDADLADYRVVLLAPLGLDAVEFSRTSVSGTVRRDWMMTPDRELNLTNAWAGALQRAFSDFDQSGKGNKVLRVEADLTRVRPRGVTTTGSTPTGAPTAGTRDATDISMEFRLYDHASGDLLAVIRDRRSIATLQWTRASGHDMVLLFNSWAGLLHTRVSGR